MKTPFKVLLFGLIIMFLCAGTVVLLQFQTISEDDVNSIIFGNQVKYPVSMKSITRSLFAEEQFGPDTPSVSGNMPGNTPGISPDIPTDVSMYATMSPSERWNMVTNGWLQNKPTFTYPSQLSTHEALKSTNESSCEVLTWQYVDKSGNNRATELRKTTINVNKTLEPCVKQVFKELEDPKYSMYPIYYGGCWVIRSMRGNGSKYSYHSYGAAIDFNTDAEVLPLSNGNKDVPHATTQAWNSLPDSKDKYLILFDDHPLVLTFKKYGWYWGGDWSTTKDGMHFEYVK